MKKRIYFIISSIIGIISSIIYLFTINTEKLIQEDIDFYNGLFDNNIPESLLETINNTFPYYMEIVIGIILFAVILIIALKDKIKTKKITLIVLSILVVLLLGLPGAIGIVNVIILLTVKREKVEKKKETLEKLEEPKREKWDIIESVLVIGGYLALMFGLSSLLRFLFPNHNFSHNFIVMYNLLLNIVLFIITTSIFYEELKNQVVIFFKKFKQYFKFIFKSFILVYVLNIIGALIILLIKGDLVQSANQQTLNEFPVLYLIFGTILIAPIVEELIFRGSLRRLVKNDILFIIISTLSFGLLHTIGQEESILDTLIMALPYMGAGFVLSRAYVKTNNLCCNISIHALQNIMAVIMIITS